MKRVRDHANWDPFEMRTIKRTTLKSLIRQKPKPLPLEQLDAHAFNVRAVGRIVAQVVLLIAIGGHAAASQIIPFGTSHSPLPRSIIAVCGDGRGDYVSYLRKFAAAFVPTTRFQIQDGDVPATDKRVVTAVFIGKPTASLLAGPCVSKYPGLMALIAKHSEALRNDYEVTVIGTSTSARPTYSDFASYGPDNRKSAFLGLCFLVSANCQDTAAASLFSLQADFCDVSANCNLK